MRYVHVITPGDHYSPRTGSAVPTVVNGLSAATPPGEPRPAVVVARGTYPDRYDSADIVEYGLPSPLRGGPFTERRIDAALATVGMPRVAARRTFAATIAAQQEWEPAAVLAHNAPQLIPLIDADRHCGVLYAHNDLFRSYRPRELQRTLGSASAIVCVSAFLAQLTASRLPAELRDRIRVVRNGVDFAAFRRDGNQGRQGRLRVVFVGRMIRDKGADVLVEAVRRLDRPDIELLLVGSAGFDASSPLTSFEREIRAAAAPLGERVHVLPFIPRSQVVEELQRADVVVVPSRWQEPLGLTALEGMAAGAAVIASDVGGIPEVVAGVGILVPPGEPRVLAEVVAAFADDESYRQRIAKACSDRAATHDWSRAWRNLQRTLMGASMTMAEG